jgi:hypothetical protein
VYEEDKTTLLATFTNITEENQYQIFLTNLSGSQTTFDLKTSGNAVEYEYVVDPTTGWVSPSGYADPSGQWTSETRVYDDNTGTYAYCAAGVGWRGFLQLNLSSPIFCDRVRVFSDFGGAVDQVDVDIYNSTSWIDKYNGTISNDVWTELSFSAETNATKARFRYHYVSGGWIFWLYEFDFWQGQPLTLPNGNTLNATSVDEMSAILNGNVSNDGGTPCEYRFQYGSNTSYGNNTTWGGSEVKDSNFGTMIHNLTLGHTYHYRVQVRNSIGTENGSNKNFTTATPLLGWVTPTNNNDPNSQWENENKIYDDDTDTYARSYHDANDPDGQWSFYIYVNHSVLLCDKVRFYAKGPTGDTVQIDQADLDVKKGGVWVDVYQGTFSDRQWVEKRFIQGSVSDARMRFHVNANNGGLYYELYEFDFNNSRPVPMIINERPTNRSWGVALRPQMNITVNNQDGASMTITWSSNSSGSWQVFGTNSSVANGTYHQRNNNFSNNNTKYWWKVSVTDGTDSNTSLFYFSTPDLLKPGSNVVAITPYWKKTSPLAITATASDTGWSGLKNVTLYYRFSGDNISWGGWKSVGVDTASPWSWSFAFSNGTGYYQFYSIAKDNATNTETAPGSADAWCGYDIAAPSSSVNPISPYWTILNPLTIIASASDATSGVKNVTLYYRFSANNVSWGGWISAGVDSVSPWSWSFSFSNGSGYYQFYSIAKDYATNAESAPGSADTIGGYDNQAPSSSVSTLSGYWKTSFPITITATASESGPSGLKNVSLFYRYRATNASSWGGYVSFGIVTTPWISCSWSFSFSNSTGHYQFYSIAKDNATNAEILPGSADTQCGYDNQAPISSVNTISPYWMKSSIYISATANDTLGGVKNVTLYYRFSTDNISWDGWVSGGVDIASPWSWAFSFSNGSGYYQFYSIAEDNLSNTEVTPGSADAWCAYDDGLPTSSVNAITPYWTNISMMITTTANDGLSGVKNVTLYYRYSSNNVSWGGWVSRGVDIASPWTWSFAFSNGTGSYQFYSVAKDNATNTETIPGSADAWCGYDNQVPSSSINAISGYWKITSPLIITASASDAGPSGLKNVTLFYRYRATNASSWGGYVSFGIVTTPWISCSWSFSFSNSTGHYQFYSIAKDNATNAEVAPGNADNSCGYDTNIPSSFVDAITPYWRNTTTTITAIVNDGLSGVKNVTLFYRFSSNNVSWGGWNSAGVDTASPWSWSFAFSNGTGYYQFYSVAKDNATNAEAAPGVADTWCGYDNFASTSSVNTISPYWNTTITIITTTANDGLSGVKNVTLFYRFSSNNVSWGGWNSAGVDTESPWSYGFSFSNGSGYYQFYSITIDNAMNHEVAPGSPDAWCGYENQGPSSSINAISGYWKITSPLIITASASDTGPSGLKNVTLYYCYRATNSSSWGSNISFGVDIDPWTSSSWSFSFPNGAGHYQFYSIAKDNATNTETVPGSADVWCGFDNEAPSSSVDIITEYWTSSSPVTINVTASDGGSGVKNITLYYRFSTNNVTWGTWLSAGVDTVLPWSWSFVFSNGTGYYQFYSSAHDNVTNTEVPPGNADTSCGYDTAAPSSSIDIIAPYWKKAGTTITATVSDVTSGVKNVTLYYRFSSNNASWGGWMSAGVDIVSPWSWSFTFSNGSGYYQFYSIAKDNASNEESNPGSADTWAGFENQVPSSVINVVSEYWISSSPLVITATVGDTGPSGLKNVTLYYCYRATNASSWGSNISFGIDSDPWDSSSWIFSFPYGAGHYQFYSIATDNATNTETTPGGDGDITCGFTTGAPISLVNGITPYWTSTLPLMIDAIAEDVGVSGLKNVTLYYYNSEDNNTWMGPWQYGIDNDPWINCSWSFLFPNQTGYYRFYSCAADNSSHVEDAALLNDTECGYDIQSPTCNISYNRTAGSFKASDSLQIYADFIEPYSGIDESSVLIAISTMGNGSLSTVAMNMIDNTHWSYDWIIPSGSDEDGPFTVRIYANDTVSNNLDPYPTIDTSKQIDNTPPVISLLATDNISIDSVLISWSTNENATSYIEYGPTSSYGFWFNSSTYVTSHRCTLSGLSSGTTYYYHVISSDVAGNQNTSLNETFTTNTQTSKERHIVHISQNTAPSSPIIDGPTTGHSSQVYTFTVSSNDANNDTITYTFDWNDGTNESSGWLPNGMHCIRNHSWTKAGKFTIKVTASDNRTSSSSEKTIWIDSIAVDDIGFLKDNNSDGFFDLFHNDATGIETVTEMKNGNYLIDVNGDHQWDYEYNATTGILTSILQQLSLANETPFPLLLISGIVIVVFFAFFILLVILYRRRFNKKQ